MKMKNLTKQISKNLQAILMSSLVVTVIISAAVVLATDIGADTIQVGDDGTSGKLELYSEQGATDYKLTFQPDGAMTQDTTYTFPVDDGDNGEVLTTDGAGALTWGAVAGADFSNGGEAGGATRTLGNTDNFGLGIKTNDQTRIAIKGNGEVGIGVNNADTLLEVETDAAAGEAALTLDQNDNDEPFFSVEGSVGNPATNNITARNGDGVVEGPKNYSSSQGWQFEGMFRIEVNGNDVWVPAYSVDNS